MNAVQWQDVRSRFEWLGSLQPAEEARLRARSTCTDYERGQQIFSPKRRPSHVFLLGEGLVRIYRIAESGAELTLGYVIPDEVFGELSGFGDYPRESFAQAVLPSQVCRMPVDLFHELLETHPSVAVEVGRQIGSRFKRIEKRVEQLIFRDVRSRVGMILLELAEDLGVPAAAGMRIDLPLTQAELATLVGASRQTVNASLKELQALGLIARQGQRFLVTDRPGLEKLVLPAE